MPESWIPKPAQPVKVDADRASEAIGPLDAIDPMLSDYDPDVLRSLPQAEFGDNGGPSAIQAQGVTVMGRFRYVDRNGDLQPLRSSSVQIWDADANSNDDLLVVPGVPGVLTDAEGRFRAGPFTNGDESGTLDIYVRPLASSSSAQVITPGGYLYDAYTQTYPNVPAGTLDIGDLEMPISEIGAWRIYAGLIAGWEFMANGGANYDTPQVVARFPTNDFPNAHYHPGGEIHYPTDGSTDWPDAVVHEYGHFVMKQAYGPSYPLINPCGAVHVISHESNQTCAWLEGWADFFAAVVNGDPILEWGVNDDIEFPPVWWSSGDAVEGRVAAALYDIFDPVNVNDDPAMQGFVPIWQAFVGHPVSTFADFWDHWKDLGLETHNVVRAIHQNTIDYDTAPSLSAMPDIRMNRGTTLPTAIDLWAFAEDPESTDEELEFGILSVSSPYCGPSITNDRYVDVTPNPKWIGSCMVTISATDGLKNATGTMNIFAWEPTECGNHACESPIEDSCNCPSDCGDLCGVVGLDKLLELLVCFGGPGPETAPTCDSTDHNGDGAVDLKDAALLFNAFNPSP